MAFAAWHRVRYGWPLLFAAVIFSSCEENDLKKIKEISSREVTSPVQRTTGVEVIYSDSAKVKAKLNAPLMLEYKQAKDPYTEMPKGVHVIFYDAQLNVSSTVVSDYAIRHENAKVIELDKNVVATNAKGDTFKSDQLIWNETTRAVISEKPVTIITTDGSVINGASLVTNEKFDPWNITQTTGKFHVNQNIAQ